MISLVNDFSVILDTCVLLPISLCRFLLRLAEGERAMYKPKWSRGILDELERNLQKPKINLSSEKAQYRIACMETAFPEALIRGYESLVDAMQNDLKDRHVLAAAVYGKVDAIVTVNCRDFPRELLDTFGIERLTPDEFLVHQLHLDPEAIKTHLLEEIAEYKLDTERHLDLLAKMVPDFIKLVRTE